ncbi:MAG TPA: glycosyltransferase family A protein [Acidimicrobiia bacterium]|nr:glycosyltransferase family A protein [Acidimicrobiia bacterium]
MPAVISVVIPVHNGTAFLAECLWSIVAQTQQPVELIVVDDGSVDDSARVAADVVAAHGRGCVHRQVNGGVAAARNAGLARSAGQYIGFCDHDDVWLPEKLARQLAFLLAHPDVGAVMTRQEPFFEESVSAPPRWLQPDRRFGDLGGVLPMSALVRRAAFDVVGAFSEARTGADDLDWFLRARREGVGIDVIPEVLVRRRIHSSNASYDTGRMRHGLLASLHELTRG